MRIAISAENNLGLESEVAHHFGRCPFFALVEVLTFLTPIFLIHFFCNIQLS